jgi:uncharacterized damage-inducible protein DinB
MKPFLSMMANYNRWANERVFDAAAKLPDADLRADGGAFFGSVHATLNHLLVTDRIWLRRMTGEGPLHTRLDEIVHHDFATLRADRVAEDARLLGFVESLDEARVAGTFTYTPVTSPQPVTQPLATALAHLFNHQAHHRGQVHALITRFGGPSAGPVLDLVAFQRATGIGMV